MIYEFSFSVFRNSLKTSYESYKIACMRPLRRFPFNSGASSSTNISTDVNIRIDCVSLLCLQKSFSIVSLSIFKKNLTTLLRKRKAVKLCWDVCGQKGSQICVKKLLNFFLPVFQASKTFLSKTYIEKVYRLLVTLLKNQLVLWINASRLSKYEQRRRKI